MRIYKLYSNQFRGNKRFVLLFLVAFLFVGASFLPNNVKTLKKAYRVESFGVKTIVIDPGHGGKDPGCHGHDTHEKDVCLAIGLKLGKYIEENYKDVKVIYTRKTDVFVELYQRAKIANDNNADLFICIHANSGQPKAYGAETYVMGLHKTEANLKVAERENASIMMEDNYEANYQEFDGSPEAFIAISLKQAAYMKQSVNFAAKVQEQMVDLGRRDRGVKQAGFLVLVKTTMPSVLIETGFLTNRDEELFLKDPAAQAKMAHGIFKAFSAYKKEIDGVNAVVSDDTTPAVVVDETPETPENKETTPVGESPLANDTGVRFKVQIATSSRPIPLKPENFKGVSNVDEYLSSGMYKYTVGQEASFDDARALQAELREKGFNGSFIVAFKDGVRMNLQEAIEMTKNP